MRWSRWTTIVERAPAFSGWLALRAASALLVAAACAASAVTAQAASPCGLKTTVKRGETYDSIARRCEVSPALLETANPNVDPRALRVGQILKLTLPHRAKRRERGPATYRVKRGDTLTRVAQSLDVSVPALIAANPKIDPNLLRVGQVLRTPDWTPEAAGRSDGKMRIRGVLTDEGVECPALRGSDGKLYTLAGDLKGFGSGDVVEVRGAPVAASICMQGVTIRVGEIRATR